MTEEEALRAYARMMNTGDVGALAPLLPPDFRYASQVVLAEIESAAEFLDYIAGKLEMVAQTGSSVFAEMGVIAHGAQGVPGMEGRPCVVMAQDARDDPKAVVMATVEAGVLRRLDMCTIVPRPENAIRSGEYPR